MSDNGIEGLDGEKDVEGQPFQGYQLHVAQQMSEMIRRKGENQTGHKSGQLARSEPIDQQVGAVATDDEREDDHKIVGHGPSEDGLDRHCKQTVKDIQGMEVEAGSRRIVDIITEKRVRSQVQQGFLHPPQIPVVLPAVKAVTGDGGGKLYGQRKGHDQGQDQIADESRNVMGILRFEI